MLRGGGCQLRWEERVENKEQGAGSGASLGGASPVGRIPHLGA